MLKTDFQAKIDAERMFKVVQISFTHCGLMTP